MTPGDIKTLLSYAGETLTLTKVTPGGGGYSPGTGLAAATTSTYTFKGCFTNYKDDTEKGSLIKEQFRKVIIPAKGLGAVPDTQDKITKGGLVYKITAVQEIVFSGDPIAYICQVKV
jgi:hypothetical protein